MGLSFNTEQLSACYGILEPEYNINLFEESCPMFGLLMKNVPISSCACVIHEILFASSLKHRQVQFSNDCCSAAVISQQHTFYSYLFFTLQSIQLQCIKHTQIIMLFLLTNDKNVCCNFFLFQPHSYSLQTAKFEFQNWWNILLLLTTNQWQKCYN